MPFVIAHGRNMPTAMLLQALKPAPALLCARTGLLFGVSVEWRFMLSGGAGPEGATAFRIGAGRE